VQIKCTNEKDDIFYEKAITLIVFLVFTIVAHMSAILL